MSRVAWVVGEVVIGFLVGGIVAAAVVPAFTRMGWSTGPWMIGALLGVGVGLAVLAGERLRTGRQPT